MWRFLNNKWFFAPDTEGAGGGEGEESAEGDEPEEGDEPAEGDEPEEGDEPAEGDEPEEGDEPAPARKETRQQRLANENRKLREEKAAAEAEARTLREIRERPRDNGDAERIRAEKLALMDPAERQAFHDREELDRLKQGQQVTQIQLADMSDKATYERKAATNPVYAKHADWIETALMNARKAGNNPTREALLRWKIGEDALSAKPSKKKAAEKAAAAGRVDAVKGKPASARGDAGSVKGKDDDSYEALKARIEAEERRRGVR